MATAKTPLNSTSASLPPKIIQHQHQQQQEQPLHHSLHQNHHASPAAGTQSIARTPSRSSGYFPHYQQTEQQQQQQQQQQQPQNSHPPQATDEPSYVTAAEDDDPTRQNTIANSRLVSPGSQPGPRSTSPLPAPVAQRPAKFTEEWGASQRGSSIMMDGAHTPPQRSNSISGGSVAAGSTAHEATSPMPSRSNTLKKKPSMRRGNSLRRSSSRRSMQAGSVRSLALQSNTDPDELQNAFFCPVPTSGNPTEALANRFNSWRKILKDLITYFREIQTHYEHKSKSLIKLANVLNNTSTPTGFLGSGGLDDALQILRSYNKQAILEANKAKDIEEDVILALIGLRSDLHQKIKEIKNLSGDFKNSVEKEMDGTKRAVKILQDVLGQSDMDSSLATGKQDPYLLRLAVDRQLERQIDEENYLHQAYLNLESSGRELESIVVGEIQKSYNAYAGILKREADAAWTAIEELRVGPIAMPKDHEWNVFVQKDDKFVDPEIPIRQFQYIHYPGRDHFACQEVRAGLLERKSKYLKSYTAGWYVLSPTHLHEFKSADKTQAPIMSLYLPEQKLGSHSTGGGSSNKFILKGRQTGSMHRGHTWVFRAESHDTMMAWYDDIKALTEKSPEERSEFVRGHSRSFSRSSQRSISSDGVVDEEDEEPFAVDAEAARQHPRQESLPRRPSPGGRFPSDLQVNAQRGLQAPHSPASVSSEHENNAGLDDNPDRDVIAAAGALPGSGIGDQTTLEGQQQDSHHFGYGATPRTPMNEAPSHAAIVNREVQQDGVNPYTSEPLQQQNAIFTNPEGSTHRAAADTELPQQHQQLSHREIESSGMIIGGPRLAHQPQDSMHRQADREGEGFGYPSEEKELARPTEVNNKDNAAYMMAGAGIGVGAAAGVAYGASSAVQEQQRMSTATDLTADSLATTEISSLGVDGEHPSGIVANGDSQQPTKTTSRPVSGTVRNDSVPTISHLHIPGEYPRATPQ